eukprot:1141277-Pelagomonas_calceolata.AAC.1
MFPPQYYYLVDTLASLDNINHRIPLDNSSKNQITAGPFHQGLKRKEKSTPAKSLLRQLALRQGLEGTSRKKGPEALEAFFPHQHAA